MKKQLYSVLLIFRQKTWWLTIILSLGAGLLGQWLQLPAAWLMGPMLVTLLLALRGRAPARFPLPIFHGIQAIIGIALSASFQPTYLVALAWNWFPVLGVILAVLLLCIVSSLVLIRVTNLTPGTAILGTVPGAASGIIAMSDELGGDARVVAFMQYARVIIVVILTSLISHALLAFTGHPTPHHASIASSTYTLLPLVEYALTTLLALLGIWLGVRLRIPAGSLICPMLLGTLLGFMGVQHGAWPQGVLQAAYLLMGINVGRRFDLASLKLIGRLVPVVLLQILILVAGSMLCAFFLAWITGSDLLTGYLATNPGGLDAVAVAALDTGANLSLVLATQLLRFFSIVLAGPPIVRWLTRRVQARLEKSMPS